MLQMEMDKTQKEAELYRQRAEMEQVRTVELAEANQALQAANARLETLATTDGDAALQQFAAQVRENLRGTDITGRWGGEEFVAVLPETDAAGALAAAEQVCAVVARSVFAVGGGLRMTCSIGVASSQAGHEGQGSAGAGEREALVTAADQAMYAAKRLGRNQVRAAEEPAVRELLAHEQEGVSREDIALAGTVEAFVALAGKRDRPAGRRIAESALLTVRLAQALGLTGAESRQIGLAARLHDIGLLSTCA